jgi:glycosidase
MRSRRSLTAGFLPVSAALLTACAAGEPLTDTPDDEAAAAGAALARDTDVRDWVLYEIQPRAANACRVDTGAPWQRAACAAKVAPVVRYRAEGATCGITGELEQIRLGTLDDLREPTADFRAGITLRYVSETVGANAVWLMPLFPNNDTWNLPDACDNLGSPYAVRDYLHVSGSLSRACISAGRDESSSEPCWGDAALDALIADAHARGMKVMLDLAFNHFGHNYAFYDTGGHVPVRERIARGEDLEALWDFDATFDPALVAPEVVDRVEEIADADLEALTARCPTLSGDALVRFANIWRDALDWERAQLDCAALSLEYAAPGFYLSGDKTNPSRRAGDNFAGDGFNTWRDVKFLYHRSDNGAHRHELWRNREYLFRVMNYWAAKGVDGFRLDHTTDHYSGISPETWYYVIGKVAHYSAERGRPRPVFLAEEFHDQKGMAPIVDVMTEGYVGDMTARAGQEKDAWRVDWITDNAYRFGDTLVMTALETHDEKRLVDGTGFDVWTGAGFWGIGAATGGMPMLLMGQELGETWQLGFRRSDYLRSRFAGDIGHRADADALVGFYRAMITARRAQANRALRTAHHARLPTKAWPGVDARLFAQVRWSDDANVVFTFFNLWPRDVAQTYYIPPSLGEQLRLRDDLSYKLVDVFTGQQMGSCRTGAALKWELYVAMGSGTRLQWLRLERCGT